MNWIGIIVAVILLEGLGYAWYGPLFGDPWMDAMHASGIPITTNANMGLVYGLGMLNTLVVAVGLNWLLNRLAPDSLLAALTIAVAAWFFFDLTTLVIGPLYMSQTPALFVINAGFQLVSFLIAGFCVRVIRLGARKSA